MSKDDGISLALAAASALAFFSVGAPLIALTELQHDEAVHGQLAVEWISPSPRGDGAVWPWPWWMKDTYQGSLKSIVLVAAFSAFGASAETLRGTTLALGAASVFFLILFAGRRHGPFWAATLAPLAATSPGLVLAACYDTGPVALGLLLRSAAIFLIGEALLRPRRSGWLMAAGVALGLGVWDKAHFLWLLPAGVAAAGILRTRAWRGREAAALASGALLGAWPILYFNIRYPLFTFLYPGARPGPLVEHLARLPYWIAVRLEMAAGALTGTAPYHLSGGAPPTPWAAAAPPLIAIAALAVLARRRRWKALREPAYWLFLMAGVMAIACLAPLPVRWHHFPLVSSMIVLASAALARGTFGAEPSGGVRAAMGAIALFGALGQISFLNSFRADASAAARQGLRNLSDWAQGHQRDRAGAVFVCDDGLAGPLLVQSGGSVRPARLRGFTRSEEDHHRGREAFADGRMVLLLRSAAVEDAGTPGANRDELNAFARALPVETLAVFRDGDGRPWVTALRAAPGGRPAFDAALARTLPRAKAAAPDKHERLRMAVLLREKKEYREAAAALAPALRLEPHDGELSLELAELQSLMGERDAALELLARAEAAAPGRDSRRRIAALYRKLKEDRKAAASLAPLLRSGPADDGLLIEAAELRARLGERDAALALLARAQSSPASDPDRRLRAYALYRELGADRRAAALLGTLVRLRPGDADLQLDLAEFSEKTGNADAAGDCLARAEELALSAEQRRRLYGLYLTRKDYPRALAALKALLELRPRDAALWLERAELESGAGANAAALTSLDRAAALHPRKEPAGILIRLYRKVNEPGRAADSLEPLLQDAPDDAELLLTLAEFKARAGEKGAALEFLSRVEDLAALDAGRRRRAAGLYREMKEYRRAASAVKELLSRAPQDAGLWLERAELEAAAGQKDEALSSLARAEWPAASAPSRDGEHSRRRALVFQSLGEHRRALAVFGELTRRFPADGTFLADRGLCEYLSGDAPAAIATLERAIRLNPKFVPAYLSLGAIRTATARHDEALKVYDEGLARNPGEEKSALRAALLDARAAAAARTR
jgi:tetratricopeptide (TPR) repeat protein